MTTPLQNHLTTFHGTRKMNHPKATETTTPQPERIRLYLEALAMERNAYSQALAEVDREIAARLAKLPPRR